MANEVANRLASLRKIMRREGLSAFIFPSTDPHNGEYVPEHWESRKWISGFTGSAGTAVVTLTSAALWTDSRYFLQATDELQDTEYVLMRERIAGTPSITEWIAAELRSMEESEGSRSFFRSSRGHEVGIDGMVCPEDEVEALKESLRKSGGITLRTNFDPMREVWEGRPPVPQNPIVLHPLKYCGRSCHEKIADIRHALREKHADGIFVSRLDDIAWTLNLRGTDVHCNPVFVSYLLISTDEIVLFVDDAKLTDAVRKYLDAEGITTKPYNKAAEGLERYMEYSILMDPSETSYSMYRHAKCQKIVREQSPIPTLKSVKNNDEIAGFRRAMTVDGVALVKFQMWLEEQMAAAVTLTEMDVCDELLRQRSKQPEFRDVSFDTIAAYGPHGAIVHYEPTEETAATLRPEGFILIDSGAQYADGTTDITRTIPLGNLTDEERLVYTLVLKGHIDLQLLHFPDGASGTQLDAIARRDMWHYGYNFLHGTGHGVGSYLNVHEGPHQIRMEYRPAPLHAGMTVTDEPGVYVEGKFGVRIENTLLTRHHSTTDYGTFLSFETLTLCPINTEPIILEMMTPEQIDWLNDYHQRVYDELSPYLTEEESLWLKAKCVKIEKISQ